MTGELKSRHFRLFQYARQCLAIWLTGWVLALLVETARQFDLVDNTTQHSVKLAIWIIASVLLVIASQRCLEWPRIRYTVILFSVFLVLLSVVKVTRTIEALEGVPLIGRYGTMTTMVRHSLSAAWACGSAYFIYLLLIHLGESYGKLEQRVDERTADLREANRRLEAEIAQRQEADLKERETRSQLNHCHRLASLGEISSTLAHEINQPLGVITNLANASLREAEKGTLHTIEIRETLERVRDLAISASEILRQIRPLVGKHVDSPAPHDINEIIREIVGFMEHEGAVHNTTFDLQMQESIPLISASRVQIQQVMINLISNALDAAAAAPVETRSVTIRTTFQDGQLLVAVENAGAVVPEDVLQRMFDPYFTTKSNGLGMGLAICQSIVGQHGGELSAVGKPEGGLTMQFRLPCSSTQRN